ncbi:MAG: DUF5719 family protein [Actinomycetota bacterium]
MNVSRLPALVLVAGALAAGIVIDRSSTEDPVDEVVDIAQVVPVAGRTGSPPVWYCPTLRLTETTGEEGEATGVTVEGTLVLVNPSPMSIDADVTVRGGSSPAELVEVEVPEYSHVELPVADLASDPIVAAVVESSSDRLVVARQVDGVLGRDVVPCLDRIDREWFVASGSTAGDADLVYTVFNPLSEDAVIDLELVTEVETGLVPGASLQGIVVPAGRVRGIDVGQLARRREAVSARIVVRSGRVAVDRVSSRDGTEGRRGLSLAAASLEPAAEWLLPGARLELGVQQSLVIHNPGERPAEVDIEVQATEAFVEPQQRTVPAEDAIVVPIDESTFGVPLGVDHSIVVRTLTEVPVVAELATSAIDAEATESSPALVGGDDAGPGASAAATSWVVPLLDRTALPGASLIVHNPTGEETTVEVVRLADGERVLVTTTTVPAAADIRIALGEVDPARFALVVTASTPVVVAAGGPAPVTSASEWMIAVPVDEGSG